MITMVGYLMRTYWYLDGMEEYGLPGRLMYRLEFGRVPFTFRELYDRPKSSKRDFELVSSFIAHVRVLGIAILGFRCNLRD